MPDWQERITRETPPTVRAEHDLRYRLAGSLIAGAGAWCDLGCGNGVAAADALQGRFDGRAVLVDVAESAVRAAADEVRAATGAEVEARTADLTDPADLAGIRDALLATPGDRVVTCFEVVEHLSTFVPLVELLTDLAGTGEATVLLSVPNDAFFATDNPHHMTTWGAGAFAELRRLLPEGAVVARQVALNGSAIVVGSDDDDDDDDGGPARAALEAEVRAADAVPTHFLAIMGPRAAQAAGIHAEVVQTDLDGQRAWEREREANLAFDEQRIADWSAWFDEWGPYLPELERMRELRRRRHRITARLAPVTRRLGRGPS